MAKLRPISVRSGARSGMADLARSLAVVVAIVAVLGWVAGPHGKPARPAADVARELSVARASAGFAVLAPHDLPAGWQPTSAWNLHPDGAAAPWRFHVGYLTPTGQYAGVDESNGDAGTFLGGVLGKDSREVGDERIGPADWRHLHAANGEDALVRQAGQATVLVTGSAGLGELRLLASSLG